MKNGAIVFLKNPSAITIKDCLFSKNFGFCGTSIYYMETQENLVLKLSNNLFDNNYAKIGAAGIYLNDKFDQINLLSNNSFINNSGLNFETPPFKINLSSSNFGFSNNAKFRLNLIPGYSSISLYFKILDYYGNHISYYNGSIAEIQIRNHGFSLKNDNSIKVEGITLVSIFNGYF